MKKRKQNLKRVLTGFLAAALVASLLPVSALAADGDSAGSTDSTKAAVTVEVNGVSYEYVTTAADGYTQIGDTSVYYKAADGATALSGTYYGTADLTYAEYYAGDVTDGYTYDAVTTATTSHYTMFDNQYTDYDEETSTDGYSILGVTDVNIAVDAELYAETQILTAANALPEDGVYAEAAAVTYADADAAAPAQYKTLTKAGYGATTYASTTTITDATAELQTNTTWGEYQINVTDGATTYLRNSRSNTYTDADGNTQTYAIATNVQGIILETSDGLKVGTAYLANIWVQPYEVSFNSTDTTATRNITYSGDTAKYAALVGKTVTKITYVTDAGAYVYDFSENGIYIKPVYSGTVTGSFNEELTTFTLASALEVTNGVMTVEYTVGSGRNSTAYTLYEGAIAESVTLDTTEIADVTGGTYSVTVSSDDYADIDVSFAMLSTQREELKALVATGTEILTTVTDTTLAAHVEEATELLANEAATSSEADELIGELEELTGVYGIVTLGGVSYIYAAQELEGASQISDTSYYYIVEADQTALSGVVYGTASLEYAEFYAGDVTEGYTYDAITTATTSDYSMFTNAYTDYDAETSTDGYNILGVSNVGIAVEAAVYVEAEILEAAGALPESGVYVEAAAITLNEDYTAVPTSYKALAADGSYSAFVYADDAVTTITDATPSFSTNTTWGEYEIDLYEGDSSYNLRNTRSDTYTTTDEDGNEVTNTFAVGSNITGIILTTEEGTSVGLAYLANIWIQPYKISFNAYDTTATRNIAYSGDTAKYQALVGQTITTITFLTADGKYVYELGAESVYVKPNYSETVSGSFDSDMSTFTFDSLPTVTNGVVTVEYTVGSGRNSTSYTLYEGELAETVTLDTTAIADVTGGTYSVTVASDDYADIDVSFAMLASQQEELEEFVAVGTTILAANEDATLTAHVQEAIDLLADETTTGTAAAELIEELTDLIGAYEYSTVSFTTYYKHEATTRFATYFGDTAIVVAAADGTYRVGFTYDGSAVSSCSAEYDESYAAAATSYSDALSTYVLTVSDLTATIDFNFTYSVATAYYTGTHTYPFQNVLDGGTYTMHSLTYVEAVEATATEDGNIAYYTCETCGTYYADAAGTESLSADDIVIEATGETEEETVTVAAGTYTVPVSTSDEVAAMGVDFGVVLSDSATAVVNEDGTVTLTLNFKTDASITMMGSSYAVWIGSVTGAEVTTTTITDQTGAEQTAVTTAVLTFESAASAYEVTWYLASTVMSTDRTVSITVDWANAVAVTEEDTDTEAQAAADAVIALIEAIGEVTTDSSEAIEAARAAYEALSDEAKALVTNLDTLTAAETAYNELVNASGDGSGDGDQDVTTAKKAQTIKVKNKSNTKTIKAKKLKKKAQTFKVKTSVKGKAKVTYKKLNKKSSKALKKGYKALKISSNGKVTVKKGTAKGTYKIKVKVTAKATSAYKKATKTITVTVKVK